ncbi:unnamed protein product [Parajaminaea phylloscopi]
MAQSDEERTPEMTSSSHEGPKAQGQPQDKAASEETQSPQKASRLPSWIIDNLKDTRSLKMLFRCWVASWVAIILLLPDRSLQTLGQAAFFVCMVTVFVPANLPVFPWFIANGTIVVGSCIGWALGCAAMAAALKARDADLLQAQVRRVKSSLAGATNPEQQYQAAVFQGQFLDPRSSTVYGIFLAFGSYASAVIFTQSPKLRFCAIFMVIVLDIMCTYGPYLPVQQYTLGTIFLLPIGASLGISFACMLFIFPETLSYGWQRNYIKLLRASQGFVSAHKAFLQELATPGADSLAIVQKFDGKLKAARGGLIQLVEVLEGQRRFLPMEFTYSCLSAQDLSTMFLPTKAYILRSFGLLSFNAALEMTLNKDALPDDSATQADGHDDLPKSVVAEHDLTKPVHVHDTHALMRFRGKIRRAEKDNHVSLQQDLLPIMVQGSTEVLAKCDASIAAVATWLDYTNSHRYWKGQTTQQHNETVAQLRQAADDLESALDAFENLERLRLMAPYEKHFKQGDDPESILLDSAGARDFRLGARSLFLALSWCSNAIATGRQLIILVRAAHDVAVSRPKSRLWFPKGLRKLASLLTSKGGSDVVNSMPVSAQTDSDGSTLFGNGNEDDAHGDRTDSDHEDDDDSRQGEGADGKEKATDARADKASEKRKRRAALKDADALPPTNPFHHFGRTLSACYRFFWSPRGLFALRFTIAGIALWIPSVANQPSSQFSYNHRAIWAIIMAQLAVSMSQGEQVFSLASRVIGTVAGALLGAALWYISCGNSPKGNPYGFGAATAVAFVPLVFLRIFAPPQLLILALMTFVTLVLVIGYSWIDAGHLVLTVNSGIGINVAWRRMLLVIVGIAAGVIVMLFPKPPSTREAVRLSFAKLTSKRILGLYSKVIEAWSVETLNDERQDSKRQKSAGLSPTSPIMAEFRGELIAAFGKHRALVTEVGLAKLDYQPRGKWPALRYGQLLKTHDRMLTSMGQLYLALVSPHYDATWRRRFAHMTALLDPSTIADVCVTLSLLGQALETGQRLPHASSLIRERALRNQALTAHVEERLRSIESRQASAPMSLALLRSSTFMEHVAASVALMVFLDNLDEAMAVVKDLVGEIPLPGFEELKDRWDDRAMLLSP